MSSPLRKVVVLQDFSYAERSGEEELAIPRLLRTSPEVFWNEVVA